jgi:predicted RNA-binding protein YlxR (DUF448 family)
VSIKPIRTCIVCRKSEDSSALIRLTLVDGKVIPDFKGGAPGRGAWLHRDCVESAIQRGSFKFAFKQASAPDVSELINLLDKK